jgi:heat shock protein HtpX
MANGDMVTLARLQGVLNTFVIFLARIIADLAGTGSTSEIIHRKADDSRK